MQKVRQNFQANKIVYIFVGVFVFIIIQYLLQKVRQTFLFFVGVFVFENINYLLQKVRQKNIFLKNI